MPTYTYQCRACGIEWEVEHRITDDGPEVCPKCGQRNHPEDGWPAVIRLVAPCNFVLKGSGWAKDGYGGG